MIPTMEVITTATEKVKTTQMMRTARGKERFVTLLRGQRRKGVKSPLNYGYIIYVDPYKPSLSKEM